MLHGMYISTAGSLVESAKADVIANNLANASTPGFQRELVTFTSRLSARAAQGNGFDANPILDLLGNGLLIQETYTDLTAGRIEVTNDPKDVAIKGDGFFGVTDGKNTYYTRAGNFSIDSEGFLTTADGKYRVLDDGGAPIEVSTENYNVRDDGTITVTANGATEELGRIGVFDFAERSKGLSAMAAVVGRHEGNLLVYRGEEAASVNVGLAQRQLESSGVEPAEELTAMIRAQRAYEANMNVIRSQDTTLQQLITQVGRVPA